MVVFFCCCLFKILSLVTNATCFSKAAFPTYLKEERQMFHIDFQEWTAMGSEGRKQAEEKWAVTGPGQPRALREALKLEGSSGLLT